MQRIGVLLKKNGGPRPPTATFSHKGRRKKKKKKGSPAAAPPYHKRIRSMRAVRHGFCAVPPDIDADEQEQPHDVDEMPVPGGEFETEMLSRGKMPGIGAA